MSPDIRRKGKLQVNKLAKAAGNFWLQLGAIAALALVVGALLSPISPFGTEASASGFPGADKSQRDALADGVITQAEYTSATNRMHACIRAAGGEVLAVRFEDYRNVPKWTYAVDEPGAEPGSVSQYDLCWMKFSRDVEFAWHMQETMKITPEKRAADEKAALVCAKDENLGVTTIEELRELYRSGRQVEGAVGRCVTIATEGYDPDEHPPIIID